MVFLEGVGSPYELLYVISFLFLSKDFTILRYLSNIFALRTTAHAQFSTDFYGWCNSDDFSTGYRLQVNDSAGTSRSSNKLLIVNISSIKLLYQIKKRQTKKKILLCSSYRDLTQSNKLFHNV